MTYPNTKLLIGNQWVDSSDGRTLSVISPCSGLPIGEVARATIADLDRALAASQAGFQVWRKVTAFERATVMRRAAGLLRERSNP